mmetsp:Transcript_22277/g.71206  ORF Transcript_22277/g.71206 Transcript_22277/m.71206 type:complete len:209 (-) Transcript_22277:338-964(-)
MLCTRIVWLARMLILGGVVERILTEVRLLALEIVCAVLLVLMFGPAQKPSVVLVIGRSTPRVRAVLVWRTPRRNLRGRAVVRTDGRMCVFRAGVSEIRGLIWPLLVVQAEHARTVILVLCGCRGHRCTRAVLLLLLRELIIVCSIAPTAVFLLVILVAWVPLLPTLVAAVHTIEIRPAGVALGSSTELADATHSGPMYVLGSASRPVR